MATRVRVGAVNYLNTKPLIYELETLAPLELILDVPSRLADLLAEGQLDVALIPVIESFRAGRYSVVPDISIATRGPVLSVTLFSRVGWPEVRRVALDAGSRTSAALAEVLLRKRYGVRPEVCPLPLDRAAEEVDADAVLLIGDRAMHACLPGFRHAFDLGQEKAEVRDRYGRHTFGQSLLLARRLIEAGTRVVQVNWPAVANGNPTIDAWDTHADNFGPLKNLHCPKLDSGLPTLIADLDARGLLQDTVVVLGIVK